MLAGRVTRVRHQQLRRERVRHRRLDRRKRTFVLATEMDGEPAEIRYTEVQVSPTFYTYQVEASVGGGPPKVFAEGKVTKVP